MKLQDGDRGATPAPTSDALTAESSFGGYPAPFLLILEDHSDTREVLAYYFSKRGFRVETAADGRSALRRIAESPPDLIVTDLSLPRVNGWELTRRLKQDPRTRSIPVIICTGHVAGWSMEHALDAGCDAYFLKPVIPDELLAEIKRLLSDRFPGIA